MMFKTIILVGVLFATTFVADAVPLMCMRYCGNVAYFPICGFNGNQLKLFNSECELKNAECDEQTTYEAAEFGKCLKQIGAVPVDQINEPKPAPVAAVGYVQDPCDYVCLDIYNPTCGNDGKTYKLFGNPCRMASENCKVSGKWNEVSVNLCNPGNVVIPGTQTLSRNVKPRANCATMCPDYFLPTCGFDGTNYKSFSNGCFMQMFNCNNDQHFDFASAENCNFNIGVSY